MDNSAYISSWPRRLLMRWLPALVVLAFMAILLALNVRSEVEEVLDVDANSGARRFQVRLFGYVLSSREEETEFSKVVHSYSHPTADWRPVHKHGVYSQWIAELRRGGIEIPLWTLGGCFETFNISESDRKRLAEAALTALRADRSPDVDVNYVRPWIKVEGEEWTGTQ